MHDGGRTGTTSVMVLHVVEAFTAGTGVAVCTYAKNTPECEHHLLYSPKAGAGSLPPQWGRHFASTTCLPEGHAARILETRRVIRRLRPDVVHSHSSFGGAYARLAAAPSDQLRQVYTPHGWNFLQGGSRARRLAYWLIEGGLASRTDVIAGCSNAENMASRWGPVQPPTVYIPNTVTWSAPELSASTEGSRPTVAMAGRIDRTKDPLFFRDSVRAIKQHGHDVDAVWIGGGKEHVRELEDEGIEVTGWLKHEDAMKRLKKSHVYLHSSLWEGFPMVILEAAAIGLPVVVRRVPDYNCSGLPLVVDRPEDFARMWPLLTDRSTRRQLNGLVRAVLWENSEDVQRERLLAAYGVGQVSVT